MFVESILNKYAGQPIDQAMRDAIIDDLNPSSYEVVCDETNNSPDDIHNNRINFTFRKKDKITRVDRELALRLFNAGYQHGHHDTVEGIFKDDPNGNDADYYHGEIVDEILEDFYQK